MPQAVFHFHGSLNDFLPPTRSHKAFSHTVKDRASIKDAIEALGVPHPEIELILANDQSVSFAYLLHDDDRISVYPHYESLEIDIVSYVRPQPLAEQRFVLDVHLGKLASYLRLLGFDTLYQNNYDDGTLAQISSQEERILLTRDIGLLKRSIVTYGYWVRSHDPKKQVHELLKRFSLYAAVAPFQRCPSCNGLLHPVEKQLIEHRLPHFTRLSYDEFFECQSCCQLYWKGAHYQRIQQLIEQFVG
ncbi:twitching motility protein PilT [Leptolyngbyaceae cyanobacterium CCMR0082]|uniref:Twitching motility protein PilT n=1 Tax=Adonisia turfae CCMR0082 TaxID=2304604 RepID=A0A6M0RZS4_9CYAN|nr:Mut7-C RNAse domain-containing protein [Adonisia turfae]NEZ61695.1 twitching motility protein PilT [Adonisia turfae CCMR0082]